MPKDKKYAYPEQPADVKDRPYFSVRHRHETKRSELMDPAWGSQAGCPPQKEQSQARGVAPHR